ncbi:ABC transporter ATP-binding protein [Myxococcus sp. K38C18041901]|uniref:ABC transporter ATP-binding protein n=1 Tax=Myxococcus guangdongensis TaxID=2906760 RepID=UPI0020A74EEF|nr:ABC transporter ATP-binding protein [Myxococcus guangdongensis]MCP3061896.1 ABC transporter ATP-binding protein [Myxococcus guangdongensis]
MTLNSTDAPPIQVRGLSKTYKVGFWFNKTVRALQGLDLEVGTGQIYGLLGPNGAGKSTTIKILMNLVRPSGGTAHLYGQPVDQAATRRMVGFLPENPSPYEYLTGREFVTLAGQLSGMSGHELDLRVKEVLGAVDMSHAEKLQIRRYSKGMVQRVALAQALVSKPKMLILDEPTSGLDPVGRRQMRDLILAERDRGTTVLFCSHIIPDVEALCDRLAVLVGGRRVREGSVQQLLSAQVPSVEVVVEGLKLDQVKNLGVALESTQALDGRVLLQVADSDSQRLLGQVLAAGGRVNSLQAAKFSLEQLFMDALKDSGRATSVGGEINT